MVNDAVVLKKITKLEEYVNALLQANDISWEKYKKSIRDRAFVERYIHMAIQTVFDIANHIIPETYRETFAILASHGVLPDKKVPEYQNMAYF